MQSVPLLLLLLLLLLPLLMAAAPSATNASRPRRQLLLVSLDGLRHDYLTMYPKETQFLNYRAARGVHVKAMTPEFLTKTFPNHWTIVTGRHQESHGIVSNDMYDPAFNASFNMRTREERWWNDSLPIWISAKRQGLKTATLAWPGGDVEFSGSGPHGRPDRWIPYHNNLSDSQRVDTAVDWLTRARVDLCLLYFGEPDSAGHSHGPNSPQVAAALSRLGQLLESLIAQLRQRDFLDKVDIIITSDHGMSQLSYSRLVDFNGTLDRFVERYIDTGPHLSMFAKPGMRDQLAEFLKNETKAKALPIRVFTRETMPARFHYSSHSRIPDVLVLANPGYAAVDRNNSALLLPGHHGFDNTYDEMKVPLIAFGPSFRRGAVVSGFRQVDVYGLMCSLLQIEPQPNNGSLALLPEMLSVNDTHMAGCVSEMGGGTASRSAMSHWLLALSLVAAGLLTDNQ